MKTLKTLFSPTSPGEGDEEEEEEEKEKDKERGKPSLSEEVFFDDFVHFVGDAFDSDAVGDAFDSVAPPGGYISSTEATALVLRLSKR
jgi:hypothetical protein